MTFMLLMLLVSSSALSAAGTYLAVPLEDPVYQILEAAQIRGLVERLPSTKPYSRATVKSSLQQLLSRQDSLSETEVETVSRYLAYYTENEQEHSTPSVQSILNRGSISYASDYLSAVMGAQVDSLNGWSFALGDTTPQQLDSGYEEMLNLYLTGDLGTDLKDRDPALSYAFDMGFGVVSIAGMTRSGVTLNQTAFAPYTFTPSWEGYSYSLLDPFNHVPGDEGIYIAFSMDPQISTQLFGDHLKLSLSRIPRNWGLGEDSLLLSGQASPFVSLSMEARIFDWIDYSFLTGTLENYGDSTVSSALQTMISIRSVDVRPTDWLYIGVHEAVVWPKRLELGYMNPLIFSSLYQGMIGDYDNIYGGLSLGLAVPGAIDLYGSFFFDEFRPASFADLFERVRNFFTFQVGIKAVIPGSLLSMIDFGTITVQYSKIEPFTLTHPATDVPWVSSKVTEGLHTRVYESFVTNGDGVCSKLDPNSDELLIKAAAVISSSISLHGSYQMIRHGTYGGDYNAPLEAYSGGGTGDNGILPGDMEYPDWLDGYEEDDEDNIGTLQKSFLHDGDYDWYHIFAFGGKLNLRDMLAIPLKLSVTNSVVYQFTTDELVEVKVGSESLKNYLTVALQVWGE